MFPILMVVAIGIIGVAYWKAPEDKKQQLRDSYSNAVETVKAKLEDRLAEISDETEDDEADEKTEPATGDRMFSYAGLPESMKYPYPITMLSNG